MSIISGSTIGTNNYVYSLKLMTGSTIYVGGDFTTGGATTLNRIGTLDTAASTWAQFLDPYGNVGVNSTVRNIYYSGSAAYICGDFTTTGAIQIYRVAILNSPNQISQITNNTGTHIGMNGPVNAILVMTPKIYFGGNYGNASPTSNLPMSNLSYFFTSTTITPLVITTSTNGFLNTENGTTYTTVTMPAQYRMMTIIYNSSLNKWLITYRSPDLMYS